MQLGTILLLIYLSCTLLSPLFGTAEAAGASVMTGAEEAVRFGLSLTGGLCLWSAVLELAERCGASRALAKLLRPALSRLFPLGSGQPELLQALTENVSANLLGLGNAATPAGLRAARGLAALGDGARDELCLLVVLNTASLQLIPGTIAALRASAGAAAAFDILPAVWFSSALSLAAGLLAAALLRRVWP